MLSMGIAALAQPEATATWTAKASNAADGTATITFTADIEDGFHVYDVDHEFNPVFVEFSAIEGAELVGSLRSLGTPKTFKGEKGFDGITSFAQDIRLTASPATLKGVMVWQACDSEQCRMPEEWPFEITVTSDTVVAEHQTSISDPESGSGDGSLLTLIIEAILWGFAMLLTPCVFPMVPMTVSFFMKSSGSPAAGRFKASMYGLFIVLLYTVPISVIILLTWLLGGDAITADIFNWLATHWLPNIIFFIVFMVFAASFFGAFEITLPSSWSNKADANSDRKGLGGVFFMALTLVLVSFSCTGPIVGSVLIKSTQGEFWTPMVTMLAFSIAFALPFTILALFPSLLKKMKSGSWLTSVKVVLGFIEVALGLKFLSVADQTYHWGILDREIYLAIWIVVFSLLGLYFLGKIRFTHDDKVEHIGVFRLSLAIATFSFVVYMVPGMFGAPLKALSGYLPPISTQDFILSAQAAPASAPAQNSNRYGLTLPHGLSGYFTLEEALAEAQRTGKPVFVDITGHGCVNCREMEARVWSDPAILGMLRDDFVIMALYTDDKSSLDQSDWLTTDSGKILKELGRKNSYIARTRFGVNAQPNYTILSPDGTQLVPVRGYNLDIEAFKTFLQSGLTANQR